ncbi:glycosyltransferase family 2 protein [Hymenobacter ginsengisoli]|uniref:Glycosyltransferase family 2 protein n=1 Tax=Hymenobacter ginsengisoli TaxID=1051626 RepID=A0ABP8QCE8_9BACT|nr:MULTISPECIES: glycosyltransferase family 2 protein [unclassified Hymenobacter]MBO2031417.1 glycosyltransferase family 2 protein [Hymenobacter sp. BT559]
MIAVILVNYNSSAYTLACVQSLRQHTHPNTVYRVVVVDNASSPADKLMLQQLAVFPEVEVCYSDSNLGFAGGNMLGYRVAAAQRRPAYVFLLNNDTLLRTDCLTELTNLLTTHPQVGLAAPQMFGRKGEWQESYGFFPTLADKLLGRALCRALGLGHHPPRGARTAQQPYLVDMVTGAAMFVDAALFELVGGLDTEYFLYCEEEDLAWQVWQAGRQVMVLPTAEFTHLGGSSSTPGYGILREFYISLAYFLRKNFSPMHAWLVRWLFVVKLIFRARRNKQYLRLAKFLAQGAQMSASIRPEKHIA